MQNSYDNGPATCAGFWVRAAAYVIDSVIVFFGLLIVRLIMSGVMSMTEGTAFSGGILFQYTLKDIALYLVQVLYFILCTYLTGTTLGKRAMNLRVVSEEGGKLTLLNVVYRETVGRFLSGIILYIGYIIAGIDPQKRALHDILCDTRVIYARRVKVYPVYQRPMPPVPPVQSGLQPGPQAASGVPVSEPGASAQGHQLHETGNVPPVPGQEAPRKTGYHMVRPEQESPAVHEEDRQ